MRPSFRFLEELLLLSTEVDDEERKEHVFFALRFQQLTGPVMAKAVEDTAFYRYHRLVCLNEVGGMPAQFGTSIESFHRQNAERARTWPRSMVTTSTHDTKRGEDTAARIAVLSELPDAVGARRASAGASWPSPYKSQVDQQAAPNPGIEYLLFQSVVGAIPYGWDGKQDRARARRSAGRLPAQGRAGGQARDFVDQPQPRLRRGRAGISAAAVRRIRASSRTCLRSAEPSSLTVPPTALRRPCCGCARRACPTPIRAPSCGTRAWSTPTTASRRLRRYGGACSPSFERASPTGAALCASCSLDYKSGAIKLYLTHVALTERRARPELFLRGDYEGLAASEHVVAFTRSFGNQRLICCVPRLSYLLTRGEQPFAVGCGVARDQAARAVRRRLPQRAHRGRR